MTKVHLADSENGLTVEKKNLFQKFSGSVKICHLSTRLCVFSTLEESEVILKSLCYCAGSSEELSSRLMVDVPRRAARKPIPADREAALRDALVARKVIPVKSTVPSELHAPMSMNDVTVRTYDQKVASVTPGQVAISWLPEYLGGCRDHLQAGKPSRYITNKKVNSAFHPSGVGKLSTGLSG